MRAFSLALIAVSACAPDPVVPPDPEIDLPAGTVVVMLAPVVPAPPSIHVEVGWFRGTPMRQEAPPVGPRRDDDGTVWLDIPAFRIDQHVATCAEYQACVVAGACPVAFRSNSNPWNRCEDTGVLMVQLAAARLYCAWRGAQLQSYYEWEKAIRVDGRQYPWGSDLDSRPAGPDAPVVNSRGVSFRLGYPGEWTRDLDGYLGEELEPLSVGHGLGLYTSRTGLRDSLLVRCSTRETGGVNGR